MSEARILTEEECREIYERVKAFAQGGGETGVNISSWWQGELRWGRNRVTLSSERREVRVSVYRRVPRKIGRHVSTNQLDDAALAAAVRAAERLSREASITVPVGESFEPPHPSYTMPPGAPIWSPATFDVSVADRSEMVRSMIKFAEAAGMYSAGYLEVRAASRMDFNPYAPDMSPGEYTVFTSGGNPIITRPYAKWTQVQCSMTVRDASGTGSGWTGLSSYDWSRIDGDSLAARAVQKCEASRNPVALEPGRYTVILEPQAVADLMEPMMHPEEGAFLWRSATGGGPFQLAYDEALGLAYTKLGMKVMDERITIEHDPMDLDLGIIMNPIDRPGPVTWVERGVLKNLAHPIPWVTNTNRDKYATRNPFFSYRMSGGNTSIEEMIRTTRRGLLVTRFSSVPPLPLDSRTMLTTGITRDGLWLIENGEITKAVKNFRFTESPLFMLNNVEQIGEPVPVFRMDKREGGQPRPAIVPAIKARDFSFTSLVDAV